MTRYFRFGEFEIVQNPDEPPAFGAVCVAHPKECHEHSGNVSDVKTVHKWIAGHARDTGHLDFDRNMGDRCHVIPPEGAIVAGSIVSPEHARAATPA
ncbi:hypothetical protein [Streptomyces sp. NPDC051173]|uniref:DUF7848 domain-containing protein n=1 Tax=Streptomyces sp. NPDC051173 TaxID=3155164 RepID=UPI00344B9E4C